jgi:hypothetical protein
MVLFLYTEYFNMIKLNLLIFIFICARSRMSSIVQDGVFSYFLWFQAFFQCCDGTQGLAHTKQALYHWAPVFVFNFLIHVGSIYSYTANTVPSPSLLPLISNIIFIICQVHIYIRDCFCVIFPDLLISQTIPRVVSCCFNYCCIKEHLSIWQNKFFCITHFMVKDTLVIK